MRLGLVMLLLGAGAVLLACHEGPTAPAAAVVLHLDRASYVTQPIDVFDGNNFYAFRMVVRYRNTTADTIYFALCGIGPRTPIYYVASSDGGDPGYSPIWACVNAQPLAFPPGATRADTLIMQGPLAIDGITHQPLGAIAGTFRLTYETQGCGDNGPPACNQPGPFVASAPFLVTLQ